MAVKNLQKLAVTVANLKGVVVTGLECGSKQADGKIQAHFLSLQWHPLSGLYPIRTGPAASFAEDNAAMAPAIQRAGRSASSPGVPASTTRLARTTSRTVLSGRSSSRGLPRCLKAIQRRGLPYITTTTVRG
jgi:hypothetical protein